MITMISNLQIKEDIHRSMNLRNIMAMEMMKCICNKWKAKVELKLPKIVELIWDLRVGLLDIRLEELIERRWFSNRRRSQKREILMDNSSNLNIHLQTHSYHFFNLYPNHPCPSLLLLLSLSIPINFFNFKIFRDHLYLQLRFFLTVSHTSRIKVDLTRSSLIYCL